MNPLDDLTVCVTSFQRATYLERALKSHRAAGIRRITIAAVEPTPEVTEVIRRNSEGWLSFDVREIPVDIGCNDSWSLAVYLSKNPRVLVWHDDDVLLPEFGQVYCETMAKILDSGVGFCSWRAHVLNEDGSIRPTEYWGGDTRVMPAKSLDAVVAKFGTLSLSPVVSVLDRATVIRACKEAAATLTHNECLERPGMLLGTEVLVYLRHTRAFPTWLYVDKVLSHYGSHPESGTVRAERSGDLRPLTRGYDRARTQGVMHRPPEPTPQLILVHAPYRAKDEDESRRFRNARFSWDLLFGQHQMIELPVTHIPKPGFARIEATEGKKFPTPFIRDLLDAGAEFALPEDIIVYINEDIGLTTEARQRLLAGVDRGRGVTICPRRVLTNPKEGRAYRTVRNCKADGGMDVIAMTPAWWAAHRDLMPDMLTGREAWDLCMRTLAEEWADGGGRHDFMTILPEQWWVSRAYCDDVCWHEPHDSHWKVARGTDRGGAYNRRLAREFFEERGNKMGVMCVAEPIVQKQDADPAEAAPAD